MTLFEEKCLSVANDAYFVDIPFRLDLSGWTVLDWIDHIDKYGRWL